MGVDFYIDDKPRYRLTGHVGDPEASARWQGRRFDGEEVDGDELGSIIEQFGYEGPLELLIQTVVLEPPLGDDASVEAPHWPYSAFGRFRERLATTINIELGMMYGFGSEYAIPRLYAIKVLGRSDGLFKATDPREEALKWWNENCRSWDDVDSDLVPLLNHSDCDGDLTPEDCARVAPALREALEKMEQISPPIGHSDYDYERGTQLAQMMDVCAKYNRRLVFS